MQAGINSISDGLLKEFRLMKNYSALKNKHETLIPTEKLKTHFKEHFKNRPLNTPDEVNNPTDYPHLKPFDHCYFIESVYSNCHKSTVPYWTPNEWNLPYEALTE